jgi:iron donor protein CyaY
MGLTESEFRTHADAVLEHLNRVLGVVAEQYEAEVLFQNGVLVIEVDDPNPGKIVISPNGPVRQIWISAQSRSFKLDWSGDRFVLAATGEHLDTLVGRLAGEQLGVGNVDLNPEGR